jgi:hypothetical protein
MADPPSFRARLEVPPHVLAQQLLDGETVFVNLESERYLGLDEVGTRMWNALTSSSSIEEAYAVLLVEYDVPPEDLRRDLEELVVRLVEHGLVETHTP